MLKSCGSVFCMRNNKILIHFSLKCGFATNLAKVQAVSIIVHLS